MSIDRVWFKAEDIRRKERAYFDRILKLEELQNERRTFIEAFVIHNIRVYTLPEQAVTDGLKAWLEIQKQLLALDELELDEVKNDKNNNPASH